MSTDPRTRRNALVLAISQAVVGSATGPLPVGATSPGTTPGGAVEHAANSVRPTRFANHCPLNRPAMSPS